MGPANPDAVMRWLVHRQTDLLDPDGLLDSEFQNPTVTRQNTNGNDDPTQPLYQDPSQSLAWPFSGEIECAGMNGRTNKVADTCYAFWVCAPLQLMNQLHLIDKAALQKYLLEKTQHPVLGGFGKFPGDLPDLYHSYLGLAALALTGWEGVKALDGGMCVSAEARGSLEGIWKSWSGS